MKPLNRLRLLRTLASLAAIAALAPAAQGAGLDNNLPGPDNGWSHSPSFGWYYRYDNGWVYSAMHGYIYEMAAGNDAAYLWMGSDGWWYWDKSFFPWFFDFGGDQWMYFGPSNGKRFFWRAKQGDWISDTQKENLQALKDLLASLRAKSDVTQQEIDDFKAAVRALVDTATPPSQEAMDAFAEIWANAREDGTITDDEKAQLQTAWQAVIDSMNLDDDALEAVRTAWQAIVDSSNITPEDRAAVKDLLGQITDEFHARHPNWHRPPKAPEQAFYRALFKMRNDIVAAVQATDEDRPAIHDLVTTLRSLFADGITDGEPESITQAIITFRTALPLTPEQATTVQAAIEAAATVLVPPSQLDAVKAAIEAGFTADITPAS